MLTVINGKTSGFIGHNKIYIGRTNHYYNLKSSPLANPFPVTKSTTREEVIELYRHWLWQQIQNNNSAILNKLMRIGKKHLTRKKIELVCYCKPKPCHGDIIIRCIHWLIKTGYIS